MGDGSALRRCREREDEEARLRYEYAGIISDTLRRLANSLEGCGVEMDVPVFASLARRMLQNLRVPYEGEPLRGIQVMGILETRNLDFRNVLLLSMNDDNFPAIRRLRRLSSPIICGSVTDCPLLSITMGYMPTISTGFCSGPSGRIWFTAPAPTRTVRANRADISISWNTNPPIRYGTGDRVGCRYRGSRTDCRGERRSGGPPVGTISR